MKKTDVVNKNMIEQGLYVYFFFFFLKKIEFLTVNGLFFKSPIMHFVCPPLPPNFMHKSCFQMLFIWEYAILPGAFEN